VSFQTNETSVHLRNTNKDHFCPSIESLCKVVVIVKVFFTIFNELYGCGFISVYVNDTLKGN